ncbi:hypothetical protein GOBAR_AA13993 [Gossypium barbadense]|uniref:Zinc finger PMZ-type domain-containing protein n=1 Tax=Gossypium barbadense TaxID=3634 RepID=A0A2P5XTH8_GOSBA|nr:hypothetical protein GOBAR_AA13993 [Gossypium barbadense]
MLPLMGIGQGIENFNEGEFGVDEGLVDIVGEGVIGTIGTKIWEKVKTKGRENSRTEGEDDVDSKFEKDGEGDNEVFDGHILVGDDFIVEDEIEENKGKVEGNKSKYIDSSKLEDYEDSEFFDDGISISYLGEKIVGPRMHVKRTWAEKWRTNISPVVLKKLGKNATTLTKCKLACNGDGGFEVIHEDNQHTADLKELKCICRKWVLIGIPYCHVVCAMYHNEKNLEAYVSPWYNNEQYVAAYSQVLQSIGGKFLAQES